MSEYAIAWIVVLSLITILTLVGIVVKPILKLNTSLVTFDLSIKSLNKSVDSLVKQLDKNEEEHEDIYSKLDDHEEILKEHDDSIGELKRRIEPFDSKR